MQDGPGSFYGVSSQYSSHENMTITVSTKVCSFGKQVVEKVEVRTGSVGGYTSVPAGQRIQPATLFFLIMRQTEYARLEGGKCVYRIHRSPMCEYMINFIHKLKHLPEKYMMNSVLENFTILQVLIFAIDMEIWCRNDRFSDLLHFSRFCLPPLAGGDKP